MLESAWHCNVCTKYGHPADSTLDLQPQMTVISRSPVEKREKEKKMKFSKVTTPSSINKVIKIKYFSFKSMAYCSIFKYLLLVGPRLCWLYLLQRSKTHPQKGVSWVGYKTAVESETP